MKLNGVLIFRITDFRRYFDFPSFWSEKDEFFRLVKPYDILDDFFFDTEQEKKYCAVLFRCLRRYDNLWTEIRSAGTKSVFITYVSDNCRQRMHEPFIHELTETQIRCYRLIESKSKDRYAVLGLFSLYMMLGYMPDETEVYSALDVIGGRDTGLDDSVVPLREDMVLVSYDEWETPEYPLMIKTLVNMGISDIRISPDKNSRRDSTVLKQGECVNCIFHENKCYRILKHKDSKGGFDFRIQYNSRTRKTDLQIKKILSGETRDIEDVVSFYADNSGYVLVKSDGSYYLHQLVTMAKFLNNLQQESILTVSKDENGIIRVVTAENIY